MIKKITCGSFGTNSYVIANDKNECMVVDPGMSFGHYAAEIMSKYTIKGILITHAHLDHIDGLSLLKYYPVYIHKADVPALSDPKLSMYSELGNGKIPFNAWDLDIHPLKDKDVIKDLGFDINVLHTPGHTKGSVCYNVDNYVFTGDTLFLMSCGRTDFPGGSEKELKKSLKKIFTTYPKDYIVYPGHRDDTTIANEIACCPYKI